MFLQARQNKIALNNKVIKVIVQSQRYQDDNIILLDIGRVVEWEIGRVVDYSTIYRP